MRPSSLPATQKLAAAAVEGSPLALTTDTRSATAASLPATAPPDAAPTEDAPVSAAEASKAGVLAKRRAHLGPNLALFFQEDPLHIVRGSGCQLFDGEGNAYLDWCAAGVLRGCGQACCSWCSCGCCSIKGQCANRLTNNMWAGRFSATAAYLPPPPAAAACCPAASTMCRTSATRTPASPRRWHSS